MEDHSKKYNKVRKFYLDELWTKKMVENAVKKKWITEEEFQEITGEEYSPS